VLFGLVRAIGAGMSEGPGERPAGGGSRPDLSRAPSPGDASTRRSSIDRDAVIDVPYTEIHDEEPSAAGREPRAG
jgi:hypothetical protein